MFNSWSLGAELFGWVVFQYVGVGLPVPGCGGSIRVVCQHKDNILASLYPEVGVSRCLGVLRLMGVQVQECFCVMSSCGLSRCLGVWVWGTQVSAYLSMGYLCIQQWVTHALDSPVFESGHGVPCGWCVCLYVSVCMSPGKGCACVAWGMS